MDEHRQGVATNGARAESRSEQGWGKDPRTAGEMHDALCEVHNDYLHATDPDWKRPSCLGNGPSRGAVKMLAMVRGMGGGE